MLSLVFFLALAPAEPPQKTLFVADTKSDDDQAAVSRLIATGVGKRLPHLRVMTAEAVRASVSTAQEISCVTDSDLAESCVAEIGDALGAAEVLTSSVGRLGSVRILTFTLVRTNDAQVIAQSSARANSDEALIEAIDVGLDEVLLPLSPVTTQDPLKNYLPSTLVGLGGLLAGASAGIGSAALLQYALPYSAGELKSDDAAFWEENAPVIWEVVALVGATGFALAGAGALLWRE